MTYEYRCFGCASYFDVIKSVKDMDRPESCPKCGDEGQRQFTPRNLSIMNASVQNKEWNPAFGKALTRNEAKKKAKEMGMIEVGNEKPETLQKMADKKMKEKLSWENT